MSIDKNAYHCVRPGPIANLLSKRFTFRKVAFLGGVLASLGFVTSGFVTNINQMYLTFGMCSGRRRFDMLSNFKLPTVITFLDSTLYLSSNA